MPRYLRHPDGAFAEADDNQADWLQTGVQDALVEPVGALDVAAACGKLARDPDEAVESDEPYGGHRPYPGQDLCRLPGYRRVLDIQQQPHQLFRSLRNIDERAVCATTLEPVDGSHEIGGA
ncbi:hypothetical protein ACFV0W_00530 [Streptomyces anulatus]